MPDRPFEQALDRRVADVLERCTACGACVEVCPMPGPAGLDASQSQTIAAGVLQILRGEAEPPAASARWAAVCSGSGCNSCTHRRASRIGWRDGRWERVAASRLRHRPRQ
ncbi:MAG: 4Fe-4S binding protein [Acetobacteraceae bacterium]|nr:4Fe-4S binding protein [Acetobacteraceae bacterium]